MLETVVVVDDEQLIRKTMIKMIETNDTGWEVVGEASNGLEALELIEQLEPELVITDIRMPQMDGLSLVEEMHHRGVRAKVIILTGYKDFAYAQTALKFGVSDFLLKPCPEEEVCESLEKIKQMIQRDKEKQQLEQRMTEETTIRDLLHQLPVSPDSLQRVVNKYADMSLTFIQVESYVPKQKGYRQEDLNILQFALLNILTELIELHFDRGTVIPLQYDKFALFFSKLRDSAPVEELTDSENRLSVVLPQSIDEFMTILQQTVERFLGIAVQLYFVGAIGEWSKLSQLFAQLPFSSSQALHNGTEQEFFYEQATYSSTIEQLESEFMSYILVGDLRQLKKQVVGLEKKLQPLSLAEARIEALMVIIALDRIVKKQLQHSHLGFDLGEEVTGLNTIKDVSEIQAWAKNWSGMLLAELVQWSEEHNQSIIQRALRYIDQHYKVKCSLQDVASHVFLNPKYFGHLFKRETGESFVNYITRLRLENAAMLLSNTDKMVTSIARECGYDDPNYFATVFRKKYHLTPNEYRKQTGLK